MNEQVTSENAAVYEDNYGCKVIDDKSVPGGGTKSIPGNGIRWYKSLGKWNATAEYPSCDHHFEYVWQPIYYGGEGDAPTDYEFEQARLEYLAMNDLGNDGRTWFNNLGEGERFTNYGTEMIKVEGLNNNNCKVVKTGCNLYMRYDHTVQRISNPHNEGEE